MSPDPIKHDPTTKAQIKNAIYDALYGPVQTTFEKRLEAIIRKHCIATKSAHTCFMYKGEYYFLDHVRPPRPIPRLHKSLTAEMDAYLSDLRDLNIMEVPSVIGFVTRVLNSSNSFEDYLRIFPEAVHAPIIQLQKTCPCCNPKLSDKDVDQFKQNNEEYVEMMRKRMVVNLLL